VSRVCITTAAGSSNQYYILWVCVWSLSPAARNAHVPYYTCHPSPVWLYYILPQYLINGTIYGEELLPIKCIFILILLRLYTALHYTESCSSLQVQNLNRYKFYYNYLYIRPLHTISTLWYNCNPSNHFKNWTLLYAIQVHCIISFYITVKLNVTSTILTSWQRYIFNTCTCMFWWTVL